MEPFPAYEEDACDWENWKQNNMTVTVNEHAIEHCLQHCERIMCRHIGYENDSQNNVPTPCTCSLPPMLEETPFNQDRISRLRLQDILAAQRTTNVTTSSDTITLELHSANAIVKKLHSMGYLDFARYLRACPYFTKKTILYDTQYVVATRAANVLISKILVYLSTTLSPLENQRRTLPVADLMRELQGALRVDIFWWVSEWCFRHAVRRTDDAAERANGLKTGFGVARREWISGTLDMGVNVLEDRMERVVELVVAVLQWWDQRETKEKACEERGAQYVSDEESGNGEGEEIWRRSESSGSEDSGEPSMSYVEE
jgi:hypothetical protein